MAAADGGYGPSNGARNCTNIMARKAKDGSISAGEDFPMLCETCLGSNPYVRMSKLPFGQKLCKISQAPYQAFRWKSGQQGRHKETVVCYAVAQDKNICQTCLNDMKYGLPVGVRDQLLSRQDPGDKVILSSMPQSNVGQRYYFNQQAALMESGQDINSNNFSLEMGNIGAARQLDNFSKTLQATASKSKIAFRNLPKLCSFWLSGTCTRVNRNTCPFRPCCGNSTFAFPEIAGSHKDLHAKLVADLHEKGAIEMQKLLDEETRAAIRQAGKGNRDEAMKKRLTGEDDLTKIYMSKMKSLNLELPTPEDQSITTLWLGNVEADINEQDLRDIIYSYGLITGIHIVKSAKCAFVEFASREMAEHAASSMYNALVCKGRSLTVNWAKPRAQAAIVTGDTINKTNAPTKMPAPPGMENAPISAYSLPGMSRPVLPPPPSSVTSTAGLYFNNSSTNSNNSNASIKRKDNDNSDNNNNNNNKRIAVENDHDEIVRKVVYPSMNVSRLGSNIESNNNFNNR